MPGLVGRGGWAMGSNSQEVLVERTVSHTAPYYVERDVDCDLASGWGMLGEDVRR